MKKFDWMKKFDLAIMILIRLMVIAGVGVIIFAFVEIIPHPFNLGMGLIIGAFVLAILKALLFTD
jgi:hypothetical protein